MWFVDQSAPNTAACGLTPMNPPSFNLFAKNLCLDATHAHPQNQRSVTEQSWKPDKQKIWGFSCWRNFLSSLDAKPHVVLTANQQQRLRKKSRAFRVFSFAQRVHWHSCSLPSCFAFNIEKVFFFRLSRCSLMVALAVCCNKKLVPVLVHGREKKSRRDVPCVGVSRETMMKKKL